MLQVCEKFIYTFHRRHFTELVSIEAIARTPKVKALEREIEALHKKKLDILQDLANTFILDELASSGKEEMINVIEFDIARKERYLLREKMGDKMKLRNVLMETRRQISEKLGEQPVICFEDYCFGLFKGAVLVPSIKTLREARES